MAQDEKRTVPSIDNIRTPNSPAFTVLGVQPTSIERPSTPADLTLALDNATEGFTSFPKNFAIEVSPYWMGKAARSTTWREDVDRSLEESLMRTLSLSFATTSKTIDEKEMRGLSYGVRCFLFSGKMAKKSVESIESIEKDLSNYSKAFQQANAEELRQLENVMQSEMIEALEDETKQQKILAEYNRRRSELNQENVRRINELEATVDEDAVQQFAPQREGFMLELAYAGAHQNSETDNDLQKRAQAFWVTPSFTMNNVTLLGVFRTQKDSLDQRSQEYGLRLLYGESRFTVSIEYLNGKYMEEENVAGIKLENRERLSVLVEYAVDEHISMYLAFGEDNQNISTGGSIFSNLGIRYNIFKKEGRFKL